MREQRRLAAVVSADVAGYSRLMGRDESGTLAALKALRFDLIDPSIAAHGGRIVKTTGDGLLLEFPSAVDAMQCVIAIQTAMAERTAGVPEDRRIAFRIGVNLGDIIIDGDDIFGDGVNIAARLEGIAEPGGVCLSDDIYRQIRSKIDLAFEDCRAQSLKNIAWPVQVWRWSPGGSLAAAIAPLAPRALALPDRPSIAVLPFQNMSGDPEQGYFVDGLVEDIITALSRIRSFFVIARNSSFTYKGRAVDVRQVGHELGVRYLLEGSVRKAGNRLRITGQLIDTASGKHIWAERYEGALEDVFDLQDKITSSVVATIEPKVTFAEVARAQAKSTDSLTAYDLYLRAAALAYEFKKEAYAQAASLLEHAVVADPNFSSAWGALANCWWIRRINEWVSIDEATIRGLEAAQKAVETGRDDPEALARGGLGIAIFTGRPREGLAHIERALELNPNSCLATRFAAAAWGLAGEREKSKELHERVMRLNPKDPWAFDTVTNLGRMNFFVGRYEEALTWFDKALVERPGLGSILIFKVAALAMAGRPASEIEDAVRQLQVAMPGTSIGRRLDQMMHFRQVDRDLFATALRKAGLPE